ncbi:NUDIX domain-containing protein [Rhodococcus zopfii]
MRSSPDGPRRSKPAIPPQHLVSYVVVIDPRDSSVFLIDHIGAGVWLPTGGHVEPGEHPLDTAIRETREELGIDADFGLTGTAPVFLTVTRTTDIVGTHVDVSLWYVITAGQETEFTLDSREFRSGRWWTVDEFGNSDVRRFDPHFLRFIAKVRSSASGSSPHIRP